MVSPLHQIEEDIYQLHIPLPFLLNRVNVYLVRGAHGWTIIDTGLNHPPALEAWQAAFDELEMMPESVQQIILTHTHPDHYGLAGWLQARSPHAEVRLSQIERDMANRVWKERGERDNDVRDQMRKSGASEDLSTAIISGISSTRAMTFPHPTCETTIAPGETVMIGDRACLAIHAPGHSDGQLLFFDQADGLMFSGDHVLNKITPNIGVWFGGNPHPLPDFLKSLRSLRDLPVRVALPGHKTLIEYWRKRIDELIAHHDARLESAYQAARHGANAHTVAVTLFDFSRLTTHEMRFALVESLAHLDFLVQDGTLTVEEQDGVWMYHE